MELLEYTGINDHIIKLEKSKQPSFSLIYNLEPVKIEILKIYVKINLANGFIWFFKSPARTPIFFNWKLNKDLCLYVDYWGLNNLTIKNQYLLPLIGESLDWLGRAKQFTQLDLTNAYHWIKIYEDNE